MKKKSIAKNKSGISKAQNYRQMGDYWDTHSLADYEKQTKPAALTFDITKRTRYISAPKKNGKA